MQYVWVCIQFGFNFLTLALYCVHLPMPLFFKNIF